MNAATRWQQRRDRTVGTTRPGVHQLGHRPSIGYGVNVLAAAPNRSVRLGAGSMGARGTGAMVAVSGHRDKVRIFAGNPDGGLGTGSIPAVRAALPWKKRNESSCRKGGDCQVPAGLAAAFHFPRSARGYRQVFGAEATY